MLWYTLYIGKYYTRAKSGQVNYTLLVLRRYPRSIESMNPYYLDNNVHPSVRLFVSQ